MNKREDNHPNSTVELAVVKLGVDITITPDGGSAAVAELTQDQAIAFGARLLWYAGVRQVNLGRTAEDTFKMSIQMGAKHPFEEKFYGGVTQPKVAAYHRGPRDCRITPPSVVVTQFDGEVHYKGPNTRWINDQHLFHDIECTRSFRDFPPKEFA